MWASIKKILSKSQLLNQAMGDVVFETPEIRGGHSRSFLQWRVKKSVNGDQYFVALKMRPDAYAGPEGEPTNYLNFDIEAAQRLRSNLDLCIREYHRLADNASAQSSRQHASGH
ncbi:hypothetical protein LPJ38_01630 [Bradyrhizobium daqingense]|uniref:hypothetical protein n=1 Tax=Bradyrhizobium daqingense TaxID=993502 RepID=UPI0011AABFE8|nr:hypothetical protein [Bradyrhizobium daqingense]UFS89524.1 hypothetical protein LPJ38_01630 [Bradyrhizobium daqingense]